MNTVLQEGPSGRLPSTSPHIRTHAGRPAGPSSVSSAGRGDPGAPAARRQADPWVSARLRPPRAALPAATSSHGPTASEVSAETRKSIALCPPRQTRSGSGGVLTRGRPKPARSPPRCPPSLQEAAADLPSRGHARSTARRQRPTVPSCPLLGRPGPPRLDQSVAGPGLWEGSGQDVVMLWVRDGV